MAVAVTGLEGCVAPSRRKLQVAEALQQKYQDEFQVFSYKDSGFFSDYCTVLAYASEYPDLIFHASIDKKTDEVTDSYVTKRLCGRISDKVGRNLGKLKTDYYVFTEAMLTGIMITDPDVTLEEYRKEAPGNLFTIYLCINKREADAQNIIDSLNNLFSGISGISGSLCLYLADDDMMTAIQDYVTSHDTTYSDFDNMTEKEYLGSVDFADGNFYLSEDNLKKMAGDRL